MGKQDNREAEFRPPAVIDAAQLGRIESVHRGFLYQHLYAVACLLMAQRAGASAIVVEHDEDLEIVLTDRRIYVQIKTRNGVLKHSDIKGALERFDVLRTEHSQGRRTGAASFVIAANAAPGPVLLAATRTGDWPADVALLWPGCDASIELALPEPQPDVNGGLAQCARLAEALPFALLSPETLVWKLASMVMAAAAGNPPRTDHSFAAEELPHLFEQLVVQLQDFPAPPPVYRAQENEPALHADERLRIIKGYSGAGKTAWVSQAAVHALGTVAYYDVVETPGPALASSLARELAARLFGRSGGALGEILLTGATGPEILRAIGTRAAASGDQVTIVLDNAHRVAPPDLLTLVQQGRDLKFVILCQPGKNITELEALLQIKGERLQGWSTDTIALEASAHGCRADLATCQRLIQLTAGLPLYIQNAMAVAKGRYNGNVREFCDDLEGLTHEVETAHELILVRALEGLSTASHNGLGVLCLCDIPLKADEAKSLLGTTLGLNEKAVAGILRELRSAGLVESYSDNRVKVHDALRLLGRRHLDTLEGGVLSRAHTALKDILSTSLRQQWDLTKLQFYLRTLAAIGDVKTLVQFATDEMFHELGVLPEILRFLETAAASEETDPEDRFWALDGLVFSALKRGDGDEAIAYNEATARLLVEHPLGADERLAHGMKRLHIRSAQGDRAGVIETISEVIEFLPDTPQHLRIFRYNAAHAMFKLGNYDAAINETFELIQEYYDLLGIEPTDVMGRNAPEILPLIRKKQDYQDHAKHLADCLDLNAQACQQVGLVSPFGRIHAMKFYDLARAFDSLIRVGQDLVDDFVGRNDFIGARQIIEINLLPIVLRLKMLDRIIPVRSQYAVVLAFCGEFNAAEAEMARLLPYADGLSEQGRGELLNQSRAISQLRIKGPPRQWVPPRPVRPILPRQRIAQKVGRNEPCPCGSGRKFKKCHGQ
ncbi:YecA family protein [Brucella sp. RRSP16]|uniref:YecA family protein n=1 Tax=Brucella sp. RRSP16 TaxID=3453707 RepID=UPI003FCE9E8E